MATEERIRPNRVTVETEDGHTFVWECGMLQSHMTREIHRFYDMGNQTPVRFIPGRITNVTLELADAYLRTDLTELGPGAVSMSTVEEPPRPDEERRIVQKTFAFTEE